MNVTTQNNGLTMGKDVEKDRSWRFTESTINIFQQNEKHFWFKVRKRYKERYKVYLNVLINWKKLYKTYEKLS